MSARILVVSGIGVYGRATGSKVRLVAILQALARIGTVDLFEWGARGWRTRSRDVSVVVPVAPLHSHLRVTRSALPNRLRPVHQVAWTARALAHRRRPILPFSVACAAVPRVSTIELQVPDLDDYDLVWCFGLPSAVAIDAVRRHPPAILDAEAIHYAVDDGATAPATLVGGLRHRAVETFGRQERRMVAQCIVDLATRFECVAFTNPVEAQAFEFPNAQVLNNGCDVPPYRGARPVSDRPTLTFVGWMYYGPNEDAACFLVDDILPALRRHLGGGFQVRIVGSAPPAVQRLAAAPEVVVTGYVDDLASELDRADVIVAPVRTGAGTRLKIIEAFAHQIPVVSTTFGASGLDVADRRELLLADTPEQFAAACAELLTDEALRHDVVANAHALVERDHSWPAIEAQVAAIVRSAIGPTRESTK